MNASQKILNHRQLLSQFQRKRQIPFEAWDHEKRHGCDIKPFQSTRHLLSSQRTSRCDMGLRITSEAKLQLVRDHWSLESWHWIRDTQLHEDGQRYRGNGAGAMTIFRASALFLLRLTGFQSIRAGMQALMPDITASLAMDMPQPSSEPK